MRGRPASCSPVLRVFCAPPPLPPPEQPPGLVVQEKQSHIATASYPKLLPANSTRLPANPPLAPRIGTCGRRPPAHQPPARRPRQHARMHARVPAYVPDTDRTRRKLCVAATTRRGTRRAAAQKRGRQPTKQEQYKPRQPHRLDRGAVLRSTCHCTARATSPPGPLTPAARRWKPPPPPSLTDDASLRGASCDRRRRVRAACAARRPGVPRTCAHV